MTIPGIPEATTVAKTGAAVLRGIRAADRPAYWPNIREGLWELVEIMHQWHKMALETSNYVRLRADELREERKSQRRGRSGKSGDSWGASNAGGGGWGRRGNYERVRADIQDVLNPPIPLVNYLRPKRRRSSQRRNLRTVLRIYCPELLDECEAAFEARGEWVLRHRETLDDWLESGPSDPELRKFKAKMDETADALLQAANKLSEFIRDTFPLNDQP
ncbi:hypothetical protein [Stackebrandtia nassauensis]|uniref:Uncharacterized protein n=1 Tax=Stackebrandtia nassauensis (strain DSM 44728 / CIP 108903 / NRRL B-16338 / NBRC 102104 / LLR-40K-21) TaxID=446470 RepID=D3Q9V2_STANL|nr:hypothetical protein [Stackebrandtia nassauensis]ADD44648.1 hypothetical protein Snas_5011 [Stackebrandtia nassauensis DSM 44728]